MINRTLPIFTSFSFCTNCYRKVNNVLQWTELVHVTWIIAGKWIMLCSTWTELVHVITWIIWIIGRKYGLKSGAVGFGGGGIQWLFNGGLFFLFIFFKKSYVSEVIIRIAGRVQSLIWRIGCANAYNYSWTPS